MCVLPAFNTNICRPKTKETARAYEGLLALIHEQFGEQPQVCKLGASATGCDRRDQCGKCDHFG